MAGIFVDDRIFELLLERLKVGRGPLLVFGISQRRFWEALASNECC